MRFFVGFFYVIPEGVISEGYTGGSVFFSSRQRDTFFFGPRAPHPSGGGGSPATGCLWMDPIPRAPVSTSDRKHRGPLHLHDIQPPNGFFPSPPRGKKVRSIVSSLLHPITLYPPGTSFFGCWAAEVGAPSWAPKCPLKMDGARFRTFFLCAFIIPTMNIFLASTQMAIFRPFLELISSSWVDSNFVPRTTRHANETKHHRIPPRLSVPPLNKTEFDLCHRSMRIQQHTTGFLAPPPRTKPMFPFANLLKSFGSTDFRELINGCPAPDASHAFFGIRGVFFWLTLSVPNTVTFWVGIGFELLDF